MQTHTHLCDHDFEQQFANCTLDPGLFTHEAHLRLAWIHLQKYGTAQAAQNLCQQIDRFDRTFGDGTKFNATVTVAAVKIVEHFSRKATATTFEALLTEFPRLKTNFLDLLHTHYGFDIFRNLEAQQQYLEPDLLPFD